MKHYFLSSVCLLFYTFFAVTTSAALRAAEVAVFFSPRGGIAVAISDRLSRAEKTLDIMAYGISEPTITTAVAAAHRRGVSIRLLVDRTQTSPQQSTAPDLSRSGVLLKTDRWEPLMHNKVMIIDRRTVITGSYNFSASAENRNAENLLFIDDEKIAALFLKNFELHWQHSDPYEIRLKPIRRSSLPVGPNFYPTHYAQRQEFLKWPY